MIYDKAHKWRFIENILNKIPDAILRNNITYLLQQRAIKEWGFCPAESLIYKTVKEEDIPELNEDEQKVYDRCMAYLSYGVDIQTEQEKQALYNETFNRMCDFINKGGTYWEIPEEIQSPSLKSIYDKAFYEIFIK